MFTKLHGLQYKVVYKKGAENRVSDALSRKPLHDASCAAIATSTPLWIQEVMDGYQQDPSSLTMLSKLAIDPTAIPHFTLVDGILRYKSRIWIGANTAL